MKRPKSRRSAIAICDPVSTEQLVAKLSPAARRKYLELELAQNSSVFVMKVFETVSPGDVFLPNWHIFSMTYAAEEVMDGTINRLITTVPPRHLKSIVFSVALPAFLLGRDPTKRIICVSYSNELTVKHANDFRAVINSAWYRRIFPDTKVSREKDTQYETMTTARGYRYATSVHGTLTGRGADLIVLDDPQKPDEALSEAHRKSVGDWFDTTLLTRLDSKVFRSGRAGYAAGSRRRSGRSPPGKGWLASFEGRGHRGNGRTNSDWPSPDYKRKAGDIIDPNGETLWKFSMAMKQSMGELFFSAQYQQEPIPLAGNIIKAEWFKEYDVAPTCGYARSFGHQH